MTHDEMMKVNGGDLGDVAEIATDSVMVALSAGMTIASAGMTAVTLSTGCGDPAVAFETTVANADTTMTLIDELINDVQDANN